MQNVGAAELKDVAKVRRWVSVWRTGSPNAVASSCGKSKGYLRGEQEEHNMLISDGIGPPVSGDGGCKSRSWRNRVRRQHWLAPMIREPAFATQQLREVPLQKPLLGPLPLLNGVYLDVKFLWIGGVPFHGSVQLISKCLLPHCWWHFFFSGICALLPSQSDCLKHPAAFHGFLFTSCTQPVGHDTQLGTAEVHILGRTYVFMLCIYCGAHSGSNEKRHSSWYPHFHAKLNFPVLFRAIYRWESWQEWVSVLEGIVLLITSSDLCVYMCSEVQASDKKPPKKNVISESLGAGIKKTETVS